MFTRLNELPWTIQSEILSYLTLSEQHIITQQYKLDSLAVQRNIRQTSWEMQVFYRRGKAQFAAIYPRADRGILNKLLCYTNYTPPYLINTSIYKTRIFPAVTPLKLTKTIQRLTLTTPADRRTRKSIPLHVVFS